jgi:hypothetical protein
MNHNNFTQLVIHMGWLYLTLNELVYKKLRPLRRKLCSIQEALDEPNIMISLSSGTKLVRSTCVKLSLIFVWSLLVGHGPAS